jgi:hypothetical protein
MCLYNHPLNPIQVKTLSWGEVEALSIQIYHVSIITVKKEMDFYGMCILLTEPLSSVKHITKIIYLYIIYFMDWCNCGP